MTATLATESPTSIAGFSATASAIGESVTHGTTAAVQRGNRELDDRDKVVDLSIGTLDLAADVRIDESVAAFIRRDPGRLHAFAPVRGFPFVRAALAERIERLHGVAFDPEREILITPGGIKGALTVMFHTFLDPGDEVIVPVPNWPHYGDMIGLHGAIMRPVYPSGSPRGGLTPADLRAHLSDATKLVILGDCINPTGKVYTTDELEALAAVIAGHNRRRRERGMCGVEVIFDCPYEAHVGSPRARLLAAIEVSLPSGERYEMRQCTSTLSGPGKTYGMHGDRIGYVCASAATIDVAARVQVNTNSFASTYGQIAAHRAFQQDMDEVARARAEGARSGLKAVVARLAPVPGVDAAVPGGGYFLFVDLSGCASRYEARGYDSAAGFLLGEARVATIDGGFFADQRPGMQHLVRMNCGRSLDVLAEACTRIEDAVAGLMRS
jgi:aspartate aminotransferase